jgi:hypothetical protein
MKRNFAGFFRRGILKQFILLAAAYLLLNGFASAQGLGFKTTTLLDNHFRQSNYNKITIAQVDCQWFIKNGKYFQTSNPSDTANATSELTALNAETKNQLEIFGDKFPPSRTGTRELKLQAIVTDFLPALAGDLMGGAHAGYVKYTIRFWDAGVEVARIECNCPIGMPVRKNFQATDTSSLTEA